MTPMTGVNTKSINKLSIASTILDAGVAFARGRRKESIVLLGAAAVSTRVPGVGTAASLLFRLARRLR